MMKEFFLRKAVSIPMIKKLFATDLDLMCSGNSRARRT